MLCKAASALVFTLLIAAPARAAIEIRSLTEVIEGHQVGGVSADMVGDLYVADAANHRVLKLIRRVALADSRREHQHSL